MPRSFRLPRARSTRLALVAAASVAMLSGCTGTGPEATATAAPPPSEPETPAATAEPTTPAEAPIPFAISCDELLTPDQVYAFNPNFGSDPGYAPKAGTIVDVAAAEGTTCGWLNQTSGDVIEIGVATPPPGALETRMNEAALGSKPVPTYGTPPDIDGYFSQAGGSGEAQVFSGPHWIVIDSVALFEPGDAQQLVAAVLGNLPAG